MTHQEWLDLRRYRIIRSTYPPPPGKRETRVEAEGLTLEVATRECDRMQKEEDALHPGRSSWVKDLFFRELESEPWQPEPSGDRRDLVIGGSAE